jgi:hypothetical protein
MTTKYSDPLRIAAEAVLLEQGYKLREIQNELGVLNNSWVKEKVTRANLRSLVRCSASLIDWRRDIGHLGTASYAGLADFWAYKYRFWMRGDAHGNGYTGHSIEKARRMIHDQLVDEGLSLDGETERHDEIINAVFEMNSYAQDAA